MSIRDLLGLGVHGNFLKLDCDGYIMYYYKCEGLQKSLNCTNKMGEFYDM